MNHIRDTRTNVLNIVIYVADANEYATLLMVLFSSYAIESIVAKC